MTTTPTPTPTNTPTSTGLLSCSANAPVTVNSGDNNGYEVSPAYACTNGAGLAVDNNSGTSDIYSCSDPGKDRHLFWNYGAAIPTGSAINGIAVQLQVNANSATNNPAVCVELSWDGGVTWTAARVTPLLTTGLVSYILGSSADGWGHAWTPAEVADSSLVVRLTDIASKTDRNFSLDWVAVEITYTPP